MSQNSHLFWPKESAHCGVGFIASRKSELSHETLEKGIKALTCLEHRGGGGRDHRSGDGAGVMTRIPFELLGHEEGQIAVAFLFVSTNSVERFNSLEVFRSTFAQFGLNILDYRDVPINDQALAEFSRKNAPRLIQAIISRPKHCRSLESFDALLYQAKIMTKVNQTAQNALKDFFFASLSCRTIVYKVLGNGVCLKDYYPDLSNPKFITNFCLFHRRFSTNTLSSWDKVQPFRILAHNGEINTIEGNKTWAITREKDSGLRKGEILQYTGHSDSGNLNSMVEALRYRSSIPHLSEIMAILIPPAQTQKPYYKFWSRAIEPWDGPALVTYCDGKRIGARLDRNGFRPCRWVETENYFYLGSEDGIFAVNPADIIKRGALNGGKSATLNLTNGKISLADPSDYKEYRNAGFDPRLKLIDRRPEDKGDIDPNPAALLGLFGTDREDWSKLISPMIRDGKTAIGSMGDTATIAPLAHCPRTLSQHFFQTFAQVTNPPLDYIREKSVTDLSVYLGRKPNIFKPKELLPQKQGLELPGPVLTLGQMQRIYKIEQELENSSLKVKRYSTLFQSSKGAMGVREVIDSIKSNLLKDVREGVSVAIFSDRGANLELLGIDPLLVLRAVHRLLNRHGLRLRCSLVFETGHTKNPHDLACLIAFGAAAVCPYAILSAARLEPESADPFKSELKLTHAMEQGLLRIMAKMGISVLRSYKGAELFTPLGLSQVFLDEFFPSHVSVIGGVGLDQLVEWQKNRLTEGATFESLPNFYNFKERPNEADGEHHSISTKRSKILHQAIQEQSPARYQEFVDLTNQQGPCLLRELLTWKKIGGVDSKSIDLHEILSTFGSGAMSFGALSAQAQRDLFVAMKEIGGRSNSGEGGENPSFAREKITSSVKQVASGRFGVTGSYLINAEEIQIKMAQGAKPGEGGQLMGAKVSLEIAKARFSRPGVDLISPPPQHDIYSIEDLKQLIYELKQFNTTAKISVKLVSGKNIGQIAVGVVKAGADIIQISGGDGGTGAADLLSMKQAGLPIEIGLREVHVALVENRLRNRVTLRVDGSVRTGRDIVLLSLLGGEQFDFGKMLLVAQGCIMARVCEKNTCPTGIATHDPKFLKRYVGSPRDVVTYLTFVAEEVRTILSEMGRNSLKEIIGQYGSIEIRQDQVELISKRHLDLNCFLQAPEWAWAEKEIQDCQTSEINERILTDFGHSKGQFKAYYNLANTDRAVGTTLFGHMAKEGSTTPVWLELIGTAGGGLGALANKYTTILLEGAANDFVGKSLDGGKIIVRPFKEFNGPSEENSIIGNCGLYGATSGTLFAKGRAGDRFCVRNSGAYAIAEGAGLHTCEYMTGGLTVILGEVMANVGAGMTGGAIFLKKGQEEMVNFEFLEKCTPDESGLATLKNLLEEFKESTGSITASNALKDLKNYFDYFRPITKD